MFALYSENEGSVSRQVEVLDHKLADRFYMCPYSHNEINH